MTVRKRTPVLAVGRAQRIQRPDTHLETRAEADRFNWYALAVSIICELTPDRALAKMGILPYKSGYLRNGHKATAKGCSAYTDIGRTLWILTRICGLKTKEASDLIGFEREMGSYAVGVFKRGLKQEVRQ